MRSIGLLILILSLSSCALFKKKEVDLSNSYVTGLGLAENISPTQIRQALTREITMGGGNYQVKTFPYTMPLLEAMTRERSLVRALTPESSALLFQELKNKYTQGKTCFQFDISIKRFERLAALKEWGIAAIDDKDIHTPLRWRKEDLERSPIISSFSDFQGSNPLYELSGVACSALPLSLESGFILTVTPSFMNFPFPASAEIRYSFDIHQLKEDGEVIKVQEAQKEEGRPYQSW